MRSMRRLIAMTVCVLLAGCACDEVRRELIDTQWDVMVLRRRVNALEASRADVPPGDRHNAGDGR